MSVDEPTTTTETQKQRRMTRVGIAGFVVGLLALVGAVMSPWAIDSLEPDPKPIDEVAADAVLDMRDRLAARIAGEQEPEQDAPAEEAEPESTTNLAKAYPATVIGAGILAACIGLVGFVRHDNLRLSGATVGVGAAAVIFQYFLILAVAVLVIVLILGFLSTLGGG